MAAFRILSNEVMREVARALPRSMEALATIRALPQSVAERRGRDGIPDAVHRGGGPP